MHHITHISCIYFAYPGALPNFFTSFSKLTHHYNTRVNFKKKMDNLEQENRELREEVSALKAVLASLTTLMEALVAAQNQPPSVQPQPTREMMKFQLFLYPLLPLLFKTVCLKVIRGECQKFVHLKVSILSLKML